MTIKEGLAYRGSKKTNKGLVLSYELSVSEEALHNFSVCSMAYGENLQKALKREAEQDEPFQWWSKMGKWEIAARIVDGVWFPYASVFNDEQVDTKDEFWDGLKTCLTFESDDEDEAWPQEAHPFLREIFEAAAVHDSVRARRVYKKLRKVAPSEDWLNADEKTL